MEACGWQSKAVCPSPLRRHGERQGESPWHSERWRCRGDRDEQGLGTAGNGDDYLKKDGRRDGREAWVVGESGDSAVKASATFVYAV